VNFWETVAATTLGIPMAAAIGAIATWVYQRTLGRPGFAWEVTATAPAQFQFRYLGRGVAYAATYTAMTPEGWNIGEASQGFWVGDVPRNQPMPPVHGPAGEGRFEIAWIDRRGRRRATVRIRDSQEVYQVKADPLPRRWFRLT